MRGLICEICETPMCIGPCAHEPEPGLSHHLGGQAATLDRHHVARAKPIAWTVVFGPEAASLRDLIDRLRRDREA
jgi:hypothetical protein